MKCGFRDFTLKVSFFLTGRPGVGKTTVLLKIIEELKKQGFRVGGLVSREVREDGSRVGFKVIDLEDGREGWLAHIRQSVGPRIGKYRVCMSDLESIGVEAILKAARKADVVVIDEVGPMELFSQSFKRAVSEALESGKIVLGTIHYRIKDSFISEIKERRGVVIFEVTRENREALPEIIIRKIREIRER